VLSETIGTPPRGTYLRSIVDQERQESDVREDWTVGDPPNEDEWILSGPGIDDDLSDTSIERSGDRGHVESTFPGGVDHTTAAYGGGGVGVALMGVIALIRRRRARTRIDDLDGETD
jgi:MYXO-CTERM domain-containing protein